MKNILSNLANNILSLLFTIFGAEILFYSIYRDFDFIACILIFIIVIVLYIAFDKVVKMGKRGHLLYLIIGIVMLGLTYLSIKSSNEVADINFLEWVLTGGKNIGNYLGYKVGAVLFISFVFSSLTYYFSTNTVKIPMIFALALIVLVLYVKNMYKLNNIILPIFILLLFSTFLLISRKKDRKTKTNINVKMKDILPSGIAIILITFIISSFIPKLPSLPKINTFEIFKEFVGGNDEDNYEDNLALYDPKQRYERNTNQSTIEMSDTEIYHFEGDNPRYFIEKSFNYYDDNNWSENFNIGYYRDIIEENMEEYEQYISETLSGKDLSEAKNSIIEDTKNQLLKSSDLNNELKEISNLKQDSDLRKNLRLNIVSIERDLSGKLEYGESKGGKELLVHPSNIITVSGGEKTLYSIWSDKIVAESDFSNMLYILPGIDYNMEYVKDAPVKGSLDDKLMRYMNEERYLKFIKDNLSEEEYNKKKRELMWISIDYKQSSESVTDRMKELAISLTKDKESYYDKAKAIESYFHSGDFKYNLKLPKQKGEGDYIDFMIFEGKEGYCVQYATAMALLCREVGLPTKYVEGYSVNEENFDGNKYSIKESDGHAFVQVYIPGFGWKIFEPTPGRLDENSLASSEETFKINYRIITIFIIFIMSIGLLISIYLYLTRRERFLKRIDRLDDIEAVEILLKDSIVILEKLEIKPIDGETLLKFARRVDSEINIGFEDAIKPYYDFKYAFKPLKKQTVAKFKSLNSRIFKYIKENKK